MSKRELDAFDEEDFFADEAEETEEDAETEEAEEDETAEEQEEAGETGTDSEKGTENEEDGEAAETEGTEQNAGNFAAMAESDLSEIKQAFPALEIRDLSQIENVQRYAELREKGMNAAEAFAATNAGALMASAERLGAGKATGKAHLQSVAKKNGARSASQMTNAERQAAREFFGEDFSDKDLDKLYARARATF